MPFLTVDGEIISIRSKLSSGSAKSTRGYIITTEGVHIIPTYIEPGPFMDPAEQAAHTPFTTLVSARGTGKIPPEQSAQLDPTERPYYMENDGGKLCLTRYTPRQDPNTEPQQGQRNKLKEAVEAWQALDEETRDLWNSDPRRKQYGLPGYQLFLKLHMKGEI